MGQMMGNSGTDAMNLAMPTGVWLAIVALLTITVVGVVGIGYFLAFPEIKSNLNLPRPPLLGEPKSRSEMSWAVLMRTSKPEEKRVLEVLLPTMGATCRSS